MIFSSNQLLIGHENLVELLVTRGADINVADNHGQTILEHAIENGD